MKYLGIFLMLTSCSTMQMIQIKKDDSSIKAVQDSTHWPFMQQSIELNTMTEYMDICE